jgi:hypothetical protein
MPPHSIRAPGHKIRKSGVKATALKESVPSVSVQRYKVQVPGVQEKVTIVTADWFEGEESYDRHEAAWDQGKTRGQA